MEIIPTIRAASPAAPPSHYLAYLNSPSWRLRRNRALVDASWQCQRCPAKRNLHVHHKSYERLGAEWDSDLDVLCENCHRDEHLEHPEQTSLGLYLKIVSSLLSKRGYTSVTDLADDTKRQCITLKVPTDVPRINDAIAVVCGNRLTSVSHARHEEKHAHIPKYDRPLSHAEAREAIALLGIAGIAAMVAKTMPSHQARDSRTHSQILAEQVAAHHRERWQSERVRRTPFEERLDAIFADKLA